MQDYVSPRAARIPRAVAELRFECAAAGPTTSACSVSRVTASTTAAGPAGSAGPVRSIRARFPSATPTAAPPHDRPSEHAGPASGGGNGNNDRRGDGARPSKDSGKGNKVAGRAVIAVAMLVGFYVIALGMVALLVLIAVQAVFHGPGRASIELAVLLGIAAVGILVGLVKAMKRPTFQPTGLRLTEPEQPQLWALVRDVANRIGTRAPDEIWLVPEVNAAVTENAGLLGLRPGRRWMIVGLPLLATMNVDQIRAVLGHELGHYSNADTRLGELNYRGQSSVVHTIQQLSSGSWVNAIVRFVFVQYAKLFFLVSHSVSRKQELAADQAAATISGRQAMQTALLELPVLSRAWGFYLEQYVESGLQHGVAPPDVFLSFPRLLAARREELDTMRGEMPDDRTSKWDTHPATSERVAALASAPAQGQLHDPRPATVLVASIDQAVMRLEEQTIDFGERERVGWPEYTARTFHAAQRQQADSFFRALSRVTGRSPENLETVLSAIQAGHGQGLFDQLEKANAPEGGVVSAVRVALLEAGQVLVRHRWEGPAELVLRDGRPFDEERLLGLIEGGPSAVGQARTVLERLGVDPRRVLGKAESASADSAEVVAAVSGVKVNKKTRNILMTDDGLVVVKGKKIAVGGQERQLVGLVRDHTMAELAANPENLWIPYESVVSAEMLRKFPLKFTVTVAEHNQSTEHVIAATMQTDGPGKSTDIFAEVLGGLVGRSRSMQ